MKYYDVMCYGMEDPSIEEILADEAIDFEDYTDEMAAKHEAELAYEGGYCG